MAKTFATGDRVRRSGRTATVVEFYPPTVVLDSGKSRAIRACLWVRYDDPTARDNTVSATGWVKI